MNIKQALVQAVDTLKQNNIQEPIIKSRILLANMLNIRKEDLIINEDKELKENEASEFWVNIDKLCNNYPLQYIIGKQEFMGNVFEVNENVLIPRQDTEILVEEVLNYAKNEVLELCTGSGIIAISLADKCKYLNVTATDISNKALEVARRNASKIGVDINFIKSNMFENVNNKYDLIVSNPPYIESKTISELDAEVQNEPIIALDGGEDGLNFYREIARNAYKFLKPNGHLCLEIGFNQRENVIKILQEKYSEIKCIKDLSGSDRVITCIWKG